MEHTADNGASEDISSDAYDGALSAAAASSGPAKWPHAGVRLMQNQEQQTAPECWEALQQCHSHLHRQKTQLHQLGYTVGT